MIDKESEKYLLCDGCEYERSDKFAETLVNKHHKQIINICKKTHHLNEAARTAQIFNGAAQFGHHAEVSHWTKTQRCTSSHHSAVQITIFTMLPLQSLHNLYT